MAASADTSEPVKVKNDETLFSDTDYLYLAMSYLNQSESHPVEKLQFVSGMEVTVTPDMRKRLMALLPDEAMSQLARRKKVKTEIVVDGYGSFLLLDKDDKPKVALHIENEMRWAMKKYKKLHPDKPLPHITPHVFRHTFCTNMANAGMDIKNLQYVMGHSDVGVTLNVYTHASFDRAAEQMARIIDFKDTDMQGKQRKSS